MVPANGTTARRASEEQSNRAGLARVGYIPVAEASIPFAVRWSFLLFTFTLPFQAVEVGRMSGFGSLPKMAAVLFFASYAFCYNGVISPRRSLPRIPAPMWFFLAYVAVYALNGPFVPPGFYYEFRSGLISLIQLVILFWWTSDILRVESFAKHVLLTYSLAAFVLAVGMILNIPGFSIQIGPDGRVAALDADPNGLAMLMGMAALMLIGLSFDVGVRHRIVLLALTLPLLAAMVMTGSRGGVGAFMIGCLAYLVPFGRSKRKGAALILAGFVMATVVYLAVINADFYDRVQQTYYEGTLSGREVIFPAAVEMILERPVFGWQPLELWYELGARTGWKIADAHNLFLHLWLEVGILGAFPFFVGLLLCWRAAWRSRSGNLGYVPLALLLALISANMMITGLTYKEFWIVLAVSVAAYSSVSGWQSKRSRMFLKAAVSNDR